MPIKYRNSNSGGFNRPTETVKRPAPVQLPDAVKAAVTADEAEVCDFGAAGAYLRVLHGQLFGVPYSGELGRNGPETPRFVTESVETFLRTMGLLELKSRAVSKTSQSGEAYTVRQFAKAE
jgi:hypothetical protein